jgi:anhydro-N-acetylmuramic acid kinase
MALKKKYKAVGIMSGTSLDGVDLAACEFIHNENHWTFRILHCQTIPYPETWVKKLSEAPNTDALTFMHLHKDYGHFLGQLTKSFLETHDFIPDLIASHGHTIFHQPAERLTVQIGDGNAIAAETGYPVVCDFRSLDVALGGQGAPLVPIGDRLLFPHYDACLNLGGFANISMEQNHVRIAFDICPVNIVMNMLANKAGLPYDKDGKLARQGKINIELLTTLNNIPYYMLLHPKSLGREWVQKEFLPVLNMEENQINDILRTLCEHIAMQVNKSAGQKPGKILVTGGGAHHDFLMERISAAGDHEWIVPELNLTDFKEALVFAFLGVLRWRNEINVLRSVTGGRQNHSGGSIFNSLPQKK